MKYSSIPTVQTIAQHFQTRAISHIVISPGSRNAPLTIAFTENPFFTCYSIVDERCAGFFALGIAQQLQKPVAVLCTSGSALLNFYPAIAEAYYSNIPLVVVSADRPSYKIDIGDGQTIRQENVFQNHIGYAANLKQDVNHATEVIKKYRPNWFHNKDVEALQTVVQRTNDRALNEALNLVKEELLPVHINVPLEEPLYNKIEEPSVSAFVGSLKSKEAPLASLNKERGIWNKASRKMVLVGVSAPNSIENKVLQLLANDPSVIVFTETTSNLHQANFFNSIDSVIAPIALNENRDALFGGLQPELLITFGGFVVSKKIKTFLRTFSPKQHWHVGTSKANDTFNCLEKHIQISENDFLNEMYADVKVTKSSYFDRWNAVNKQHQLKREAYLAKIPFSDFSVFDAVLKSIPENCQLQLANSSTIRYTQLFNLNSSLSVFCNRGTSGIDGSTSTAIGASLMHKHPTVLITGDLSFFYDSNALWNSYLCSNFRIILINNSGGGIFRILPGKNESDNFKTFFETKHSLTADALCTMYNIEYQSANSIESLGCILKEFYNDSSKPKLLEVFTPRLINDKILMDYFHFLS